MILSAAFIHIYYIKSREHFGHMVQLPDAMFYLHSTPFGKLTVGNKKSGIAPRPLAGWSVSCHLTYRREAIAIMLEPGHSGADVFLLGRICS